MMVRHDGKAVVGDFETEIGGALNAGCVPGKRDARIGSADRMNQ